MRVPTLTAISIFAVGVFGFTAASVEADPPLASLLATIRPAEGEDLFAEIPWQTSLWEARVLAAKEGKPILLWEMDGHPLGCG